MEFTKSKRVFSKHHGKLVAVLEYKSKSNVPYMECSRCGKDIKRTMYVVQDIETGVEMEYLGTTCAKHI